MTCESLGQRVRQLRSELGLTQTELANQSGVSHSALSKIENSQLSPTFEMLLRIADGLEIDISKLLASTDGARTVHVGSLHGTVRVRSTKRKITFTRRSVMNSSISE